MSSFEYKISDPYPTLCSGVDTGFGWFSIIYCDHLVDDGEELYGEVDFNDRKIYIKFSYDLDVLKSTILHELYHICFYMSGMQRDSDKYNEEEVVGMLSNMMFILTHLNPDLILWIHNHEDRESLREYRTGLQGDYRGLLED